MLSATRKFDHGLSAVRHPELHGLDIPERIVHKLGVMTYVCQHGKAIDYKLAVLTYKVRSTGTPSYLSRHIKPKIPARHLRSSSPQLLQKSTTRTQFADRAFRCTAPTVWKSLNSYTVDSGSLAVFKSRLKTFLFRRTFHPV